MKLRLSAGLFAVMLALSSCAQGPSDLESGSPPEGHRSASADPTRTSIPLEQTRAEVPDSDAQASHGDGSGTPTSTSNEDGAADAQQGESPEQDESSPESMDAGATDRVLPEVPPVALPAGIIPGETEVAVCLEIQERLGVYRTAAVENEIPVVLQLLPTVEDFEIEIFSAAHGHDWGDQIIEQLTNARREWSTALAVLSSGEDRQAADHMAMALGHIDAALAVSCPQ